VVVVDDPKKPKRAGSVHGPRNEDHKITTPGRGLPETLPPPRHDEFDFEDGTPPAMDPSTYRAIKKLRDETLKADEAHTKRLDQVELGQVHLASAATVLATRMNGVEVSHARMEGAFSVMTGAINDEREEKKQLRAHKRKVGLRWLRILGSAVSSGGVITIVVLALLGKC